MEKALACYRRIIDFLFQAVVALAAVIIGLDVLAIFSEAVGRYAVGSSRAFMEELPRLMVPFVVFPMMAVLLRLKRHIAVDILPSQLQGKARALVLILANIVVIAVAGQFFMAGLVAIKYFYQTGFETHTEIIFKLWVTYLPFPVGFGLLILFAVESLWSEIINFIKPSPAKENPL